MNTQTIPGQAKRKGRVAVLIAGVSLILAGMLAMLYPFHTYIRLVKYLGPALFINGCITLILAYRFPKGSDSRNWMLLKSALDLGFALVLSFNPFLTFIAFPLLSGPLIFCSGLAKIIGGMMIRKEQNAWPVSLSAGMLFVVFGLLLTRASYGPAANVSSLTGLFAIILGILYLSDSLRSNLPPQRTDQTGIYSGK